MKYTVEGFSQTKMVELGLNADDAIMLRWFVDFYHTGSMATVTDLGKTYVWVKYQAVIDDLPILRIKTTDNISRHFQKFIDCGLMEHYTKKYGGGTFSCFRLVEEVYSSLVEDIKPTLLKSSLPPYSKVGPKDYSIKNTTTVENTSSSNLELEEVKQTLLNQASIIETKLSEDKWLEQYLDFETYPNIKKFIYSMKNPSVKELSSFLQWKKDNPSADLLQAISGYIINGIDSGELLSKKTSDLLFYSASIFYKYESRNRDLALYVEETK